MIADTAFSVNSEVVDATLVVSILGVLDLRTEAELVDSIAEQLDRSTPAQLVVNVIGVEFID